LICVMIWLSLSPHVTEKAARLDTTLGSFHLVQFVGNLSVTLANCLYSCENENYYTLLLFLYLAVSVIGTNTLCHRYLLERAKVMNRLMEDEGESAVETLETLERYFGLEGRTIYFVLLGVAVHFVGYITDGNESDVNVTATAFKILEYAILLIMALDTYFSIVITSIFLRPVLKVLREGKGQVAAQSKGYVQLQKTMYMTLFGSSMAVISSTYLYINLLLFFDEQAHGLRNTIETNPIWNPLVIAGNMDSIVNDIGMLFVSGVFKHAGAEVFSTRLGTFSKGGSIQSRYDTKKDVHVQPFNFNSRAYDED